MKFVELKKDLMKNIRPCYLISGNDRFLCYKALEQIKEALHISYDQMNEVVLAGESTTPEEIVRAVSVFPFMDDYRLVQVNNFSGRQKSKKDEEELIEYLKNPLQGSVLVFMNLDNADALKPFMSYLSHIDCDKLDENMLKNVLKSRLNNENHPCKTEALDKLILYCNNDMSRLDNELKKLMSYAEGREISADDVEELVVEDKEYQVFELSEYIARGDKEKALDLVYTLSNGKSGFSLLAPLYNNFRRALFVAINKDKTDEELANLLSVKPYAVKMTKNQVKYFTPKKLKAIVDMLYEADRNIKTGKIKEEIAIKTTVLNILKIRG